MIAVDDYVVLHVLKIRGLASADQVAVSLGCEPADVEAALQRAVESETARYRDGRMAGYLLTSAGREKHDLLRPDAVSSEAAARLADAYEAFLEPNHAFKQVTTDWQLRESGADTAPILSRLDTIDQGLSTVLDPAAAADPRFAVYRSRFSAALSRLHGGDDTAFARPMSESYHDVWMELHEDLVASLGRERTEADE